MYLCIALPVRSYTSSVCACAHVHTDARSHSQGAGGTAGQVSFCHGMACTGRHTHTHTQLDRWIRGVLEQIRRSRMPLLICPHTTEEEWGCPGKRRNGYVANPCAGRSPAQLASRGCLTTAVHPLAGKQPLAKANGMSAPSLVYATKTSTWRNRCTSGRLNTACRNSMTRWARVWVAPVTLLDTLLTGTVSSHTSAMASGSGSGPPMTETQSRP